MNLIITLKNSNLKLLFFFLAFLLISGIPGHAQVVFGVATAPAKSRVVRDAGFRFIEMNVQRDLMPGKPEEEYAAKKRELDTCFLPIIACNSFLPKTLKVTGPIVNRDTIMRYAEVAFRRAEVIGIKTIVFGCSGARTIPDGFDRQQARRQFISLLKEMGPLARKYGITLAIENLHNGETNFINTVREGVEIAREIDDPNVRVLADFYHMMTMKEGPEALIEAGDYLVHCHIAEAGERTAPGIAGNDFRPYFAALKKIGYKGAIAIEGSWKPENLPHAWQVMNDQWDTTE